MHLCNNKSNAISGDLIKSETVGFCQKLLKHPSIQLSFSIMAVKTFDQTCVLLKNAIVWNIYNEVLSKIRLVLIKIFRFYSDFKSVSNIMLN